MYWTSEVDKFSRIFWKPAGLREPADQGKLNAVVDIAVGRFQDLEDEDQEDFRTVLAQFLRLYSFLAHIVVFKDPKLEKLHEYGRWLIRKLPRAEAVTNLALILDKPDLAQALKNQMLDWIYHGLQERKSIPELLATGESDTVEFKSSARWNLHAGKETPEIKDAITKTVAAFLNTDGGTLLIGVNDDAKVVGLENDTQLVKGKDLDGFENWLMGAHLQSTLGKPAAAHVKVSWGNLDGGDVYRLDVHPSPQPVYVKTSSAPKVFYVRLGNSTHEYDIEEAVEYIKAHRSSNA